MSQGKTELVPGSYSHLETEWNRCLRSRQEVGLNHCVVTFSTEVNEVTCVVMGYKGKFSGDGERPAARLPLS